MQVLLENLIEYTGVEVEFSEAPAPIDFDDIWAGVFDAAIPEFAAGQGKMPKCKEGNFPCGRRCLSGRAKRKDGQGYQCRKMLPGQAKNFAEFLEKQKSAKPAGEVKTTSKSTKRSSTPKKTRTRKQPSASANKTTTNKSKQASKPVNKKGTANSQQEFEDLMLTKLKKRLDNSGGNDILISDIRADIGGSVSRKQFNDMMLKMQEDDLVQLYGGSPKNQEIKEQVDDALSTELDGLRIYVRVNNLSDEDLTTRTESAAARVKEIEENKPESNPLGSAAKYQKGGKITDQGEFDKAVDDIYHRLNHEFNSGGLVPISKIRESFGDRLTKEEFDDKMQEFNGNQDNVVLTSSSNIDDTGAVTDFFGNAKNMMQAANEKYKNSAASGDRYKD